MPIYEYRCEKCAHEYEKREGFDAPARQRCPKCRGKAQRVLYAAPIVFKGSGFYVTDNRKETPEADSKSESKTDESKTESKADSSKSSGDSSGKDAEPAAAG